MPTIRSQQSSTNANTATGTQDNPERQRANVAVSNNDASLPVYTAMPYTKSVLRRCVACSSSCSDEIEMTADSELPLSAPGDTHTRTRRSQSLHRSNTREVDRRCCQQRTTTADLQLRVELVDAVVGRPALHDTAERRDGRLRVHGTGLCGRGPRLEIALAVEVGRLWRREHNQVQGERGRGCGHEFDWPMVAPAKTAVVFPRLHSPCGSRHAAKCQQLTQPCDFKIGHARGRKAHRRCGHDRWETEEDG